MKHLILAAMACTTLLSGCNATMDDTPNAFALQEGEKDYDRQYDALRQVILETPRTVRSDFTEQGALVTMV